MEGEEDGGEGEFALYAMQDRRPGRWGRREGGQGSCRAIRCTLPVTPASCVQAPWELIWGWCPLFGGYTNLRIARACTGLMPYSSNDSRRRDSSKSGFGLSIRAFTMAPRPKDPTPEAGRNGRQRVCGALDARLGRCAQASGTGAAARGVACAPAERILVEPGEGTRARALSFRVGPFTVHRHWARSTICERSNLAAPVGADDDVVAFAVGC